MKSMAFFTISEREEIPKEETSIGRTKIVRRKSVSMFNLINRLRKTAMEKTADEVS